MRLLDLCRLAPQVCTGKNAEAERQTAMNAAAEIEFLERLFALPSEVETMSENELNQIAAEAIAEAELAAKRAGKVGPWCFYCGHHDVSTSTCACPFPESFGCAGKRVCTACDEAMRAVADHVQQMFQQKRVNRVSSVRARMYRQVREAAEGLRRGEELRTALARFADPWDDEGGSFRENTLKAFRRAQFFDWKRLAAGIEQAKQDHLIMSIVRSGILRRP